MAYLLLFLDPGRSQECSQCPVKISLHVKILKLISEPENRFLFIYIFKNYRAHINMGLIAIPLLIL